MISYILTSSKESKKLENMADDCNDRYPVYKIYDLDSFNIILLNKSSFDHKNIYKTDNEQLFIFGRISNIQHIKSILLPYTPCSNAPIAESIYMLCKKLGFRSLGLLEGSFSIVYYKDNQVRIYNGMIASTPCYYTQKNKDLWVSGELKNFLTNSDIDTTLLPFEQYHKSKKLVVPIFNYINKLTYGHLLLCEMKNNEIITSEIPIQTLRYNISNPISFQQHLNLIDEVFNQSLLDNIDSNWTSVGTTLSSGVDCTLQSYKLRKLLPNINIESFTVGSDNFNEFSGAEKVSKIIGSSHHNIILSKKEILNSFINNIFLYETPSSLSLEIFLSIQKVYQYSSSMGVKNLFMGHGPDATYGGYFVSNTPINIVNPLIRRWLIKACSNSLLAPFVETQYGLSVKAPLYNNKLAQLAISTSPYHKLKNGHGKYIWRTLSQRVTNLPEEIIWGNKKQVQEGSPVSKVFSELFGVEDSSEYEVYTQKDPYIYNIFKEIFEKKVVPSKVDLDRSIYYARNGSI